MRFFVAAALAVSLPGSSFAQGTEINQPTIVTTAPATPVANAPAGVTTKTSTVETVAAATPAVAAGPVPPKKKSNCLKYVAMGAAGLAAFAAIWPALNAADGGAEAAKDNAPVKGDIKSMSPEQAKCKQNAPSKPGRIVIGFDGLGGKSVLGQPLLNNMIMPATRANKNVYHQYYSQADIDSDTLSDSVRCAYEWATKPYKNSKGETVYSTLTIMGYSYGGHAAAQLADNLKKLGVNVDLIITADAREKWAAGPGHFAKTGNIKKWINVHEGLDPMGLVGATVDGGENINVTGKAIHGNITKTDAIQNAIQTNMSQMPRCRIGYGNGYRYGTAAECNF